MSKQTPQVEDGFVRIANELYDAILLAGFGKRELLVLLAVIRKTYGFGKKEDDMTMTQLASATGLQLPHVSATVRELEERQVLAVGPGVFGKVIGVQKNHRLWKAETAPKTVTKTVIPEVTKTVTAYRNGHADMTETVTIEVTETVTSDDRNGHNGLPKRSVEVTETVNTIDNSKRQLQKTTPKDIGSGPVGPLPGAGKIDAEKDHPTSATWRAYSDAFQDRYGIPPPRNARASGMLKQFLARIGAEEAPEVARWYLGSNDRWYVAKGHAIDYLLNDAEKLRTEWATRRRITHTAAKQADRTQAAGQVWLELMQENAASEH